MGADFAYIGSAFIATEEARASDAYKQAIVDGSSDDIVYSNLFTGVHGNYLAPLDRSRRPGPGQPARERPEQDELRRRRGRKPKAWKDIWGCGPGHRRGQGGGAGARAGRAPRRRVRGGAPPRR